MREGTGVYFWNELDAHGDRPALIDADGRTISHAELAAMADAVGGELAAGGVLLLELTNRIDAIAAYIGALRARCPVIVMGSDTATADALMSRFAPDFTWSAAAGLRRHRPAPEPHPHPDLAVLLSTSGTTGSTKLVRLSADAVDANARSIAAYLGLDAAERAITTLPPEYSYGLSVINSHLACGGSLLLNDHSVIDAAFRALADRHGATSMAGVPYTYELLERAGFRTDPVSGIRTLTQAGGRLSPERVGAWSSFAQASGRRFFVMYGQTEAAPRMAYMPPELLDAHPDCIGRPIPGGRLELIDPDTGREGAAEGELVYYGPNVMMGYAEDRAALARGPELDRLHTGDLAQRVEPDLFRIVGRSSRFIKLFGLRLSLDEVEREAARNGAEVVATGTDEQLVLACEKPVEGAALVSAIAARYAIPEGRIAFVPLAEIPRLVSGKIDYRTIVASAARMRAEAPAVEGESAEEALLRLFRRAFPHRQIAPSDSFLSLDGDSLSYINVSLGVEEITGVLPEQWETRPIAELAEAGRPSEARRWARVEPSVLIRAVAPIMVVANHAGDTALRGGAALLLILVGQNFGRFSRTDLIGQRYGKLFEALFLNILIPYWLILGAFEGAKHAISLPELLLINNMLGRPSVAPFETWFVQVLLQAMLIYVAMSLARPVRDAWRDRPFEMSFAILALAAALGIAHRLWMRGVLDNAGREISWQLWLFALGVATNFAIDTRRRLAIVAVAAGMAVVMYGEDPPRIVAVVGGTAMLLWLRRISLPLLVLPLVSLIGSASLFIYMMHGRAPVHGPTSGWPVDVIRIGVGIAFGLIAWLAYRILLERLRALPLFSRRAPSSAGR